MANDDMSGGGDSRAVREALRAELGSLGLGVASDTLGMRDELYVTGDDDLARGLFHFGTDAQDAAEKIYRTSGSWVDGMPPRFVVLPAGESDSAGIEILEQIHTTPVFYTADAGGVRFAGLEAALGRLLGG